MKFTRSLILLAAAFAISAPMAVAQVPSIGVVAPAMRPTFSAATAITPAASPTDILTITGSATKTVRVTKAFCSGVATAAAAQRLDLVKRSTANSGGTSATVTAVPHDSANSAASGVARVYSANPTTGTLVGAVRSGYVLLATALAPTPLEAGFSNQFTTDQAITLRGVAQSLSINGVATSLPAGGALTCGFEWNEQ